MTSTEMNNGDEFNEQRLREEYLQSLAQVAEGQMVPGQVVEVDNEFIYVDVGLKSEGKISIEEFEAPPAIGETVYVILLNRESRRGEVVVSKKKADEKLFWKNLRIAFDQHEPVPGTISRRIKGGFEVDLGNGVTAFLPLSKTDIFRVTDTAEYVGLKSSFLVERLYHHSKVNIVVNRRQWLEQENSRRREEFFQNTEIGDEVEGVVKTFTSFGAFVDLGGFDGLLHINDMSWGHINSPKEIVSLGDEIRVKVIRLDPEERKINLSLKHFSEDPWTHFEDHYQVGGIVKGKVTKLTDFGAFIEIEEGIEGLAHISELSWVKKIRHPKELLHVHDIVEIKILSYDIQQSKLSLGLKQVLPNPWDDIDSRYPVGMRLKRKIKNITNFGVFLEIEEGIDGLLHLDDMSWTKRPKHPSSLYNEGDEIEVMVIDIDKENQRIKLGVKQLTEDPWRSLAKAFPRGSVIEGQITSITDFGVFVKVQGDIEGLVNKSNLFDPSTESIEDVLERFKVGDTVKAVVTDINVEKQKLALSIREYTRQVQAEAMVQYIHDDSEEEKTTLADFIKDKNKD
ncbi:MAG: 30S ribosomal protein S1 [Spirochaetaceae bacterium]|nr:MAG: 30S ribosomal protein S1 [Spirochaetaceae bacterium]